MRSIIIRFAIIAIVLAVAVFTSTHATLVAGDAMPPIPQ